MKTQKWHQSLITNVRYASFPEPYQIRFGSDLRDGVTPEFAKSIDVILNVSDTPGVSFDVLPEQRAYWFPLNELGYWGYALLFGIIRCLEANRDKSVYIHCHAGVYRAPRVAAIWAYYNGINLDTSIDVEKIPNIPQCENFKEFISRMKERPTHSLVSILVRPKPLEYSAEIFHDQSKMEKVKEIYEPSKMA